MPTRKRTKDRKPKPFYMLYRLVPTPYGNRTKPILHSKHTSKTSLFMNASVLLGRGFSIRIYLY